MAKNIETVEPTVTIKSKNLKLAGWIAGGALALGATFAAGAAFGREAHLPFGGDFAAGSHGAPGQFGPGDGDGDGEHRDGFGDNDGDHRGPQGGFQAPSQGGPAAPSAPSAPSAPAPSTTP